MSRPTFARDELWNRVRHPNGPVTRALKRAGLTALGTYAAYLAHGLLHRELLHPDVTEAERTAALPGDELVPEPHWVTNFAIDIAATPAQVWPWLVQMGYGRAGWYTWFPLDNGGVPSADVLIPALQNLAVGDVFPDGARAQQGFGIWRVKSYEPARSLVLHSRRDPVTGFELPAGSDGDGTGFMDCTWVFVLTPTGPGASRLRVRVRACLRGRLGRPVIARAVRLLFGLGDNVMENSMLQGIRQRAEAAAAADRTAA